MMKISLALVIGAAVLATSGPAFAASRKQRECAEQGALVGTIQQARLAGVRRAQLRDAVAKAQPDLSEAMLDTVPQLGDFVYGLKRGQLKQINLGQVTQQQCLDNWDQVQQMRKQLN